MVATIAYPTAAHPKEAETLWDEAIKHAFPNLKNDPRGNGVGKRLFRLHSLRNRVAHGENLLLVDVDARFNDCIQLVNAIAPELRDLLESTSETKTIGTQRPNTPPAS